MVYRAIRSFFESILYTVKLVSFLYFDSIVVYVAILYLLTQWVSPLFFSLCLVAVFFLFLARESLHAPTFVATLFYAYLFASPISAEHIALAVIVLFAQFRFFLRKATDSQSQQEKRVFLDRLLKDVERT